jgi:hypothetical protein
VVDQSRFPERTWKPRSPAAAPVLSKDTLNAIIRTTRVPKEKHSIARNCIRRAVQEVFDEFVAPLPKIPPSCFKRIVQVSDEFVGELDQLDGRAAQLLDIFLKLFLKNFSRTPLKNLKSDARTLSEVARRLARKRKNPPHRPRGSRQNRPFHNLVHKLYIAIVERSHGTFAVQKHSDTGKPKGTVPAVLQLLRPYLQEIIPKQLSYSTMRRMLIATATHRSQRRSGAPISPQK